MCCLRCQPRRDSLVRNRASKHCRKSATMIVDSMQQSSQGCAERMLQPANTDSLRPAKRLPALIGISLVALSILTRLATYTVLTGLTTVKPTPNILVWLLAGNLVLVLAMVVLILWQAGSLVAARRKREAGAGLHIRLVSLFSVIAALPAIIVAAFAAVTLDRGLDAWFSQRTRSIVDSAVIVAEA